MNFVTGAFSEKRRRVASAAAGVALATLTLGLGPAPASSAAADPPQVKSWGTNLLGQLGIGTPETRRTTPVTVAGLAAANVTAVSAGGQHSLALLDNGTVQAWGNNDSGELGDGTSEDHPIPGVVTGLLSVRSISAGGSFSLARLSNGTVQAWGDNAIGQLGNGVVSPAVFLPAPVTGLTGVVAIAAGGTHGLALLSNGTVRAWGDNSSGQLGNGITGGNSPVPVPVVGPGGVGVLSNVKAIAAGNDFSMALLNDGTVRAWGINTSGQLAQPAPILSNSVPVPVVGPGGVGVLSNVKAVDAGGAHSLALLTNNTVRSWGLNNFGQLGNGVTGGVSRTPVTVLGPGGVGVLSDVALIAAGSSHSIAYLTNGPVNTWGNNFDGALGDGSIVSRDTPIGIRTGLIGITSIAAGTFFSLAA
ncbi:RCC1 domain-containing protein [Planotetraspora mira]|uniref:RCC1-like domain-containing protein n=1 Tax=Planotetraspora mira TaxID=58121 RepID=A0A8J3U888_9ACTN|nr:chromosome condensation regulator RCC1 [Planotetraspora mira]GII34365.1 hypothetical protein Pmi06nite_78070 [Planotetraspora mira]